MPSRAERQKIVSKIKTGNFKDAFRELCTFYGLDTPSLMTPEEMLAHENTLPAFFGDDMFLFSEREELQNKFPKRYSEFVNRTLKDFAPMGITTIDEFYKEFIPKGKKGRAGAVFPWAMDYLEGKMLVVISKESILDPVVILHEFWEYYPRERFPGEMFEVHTPSDPGAWVNTFLFNIQK